MSSMHTVDEIIIHADPAAIYRAAAEIERWPAILPHYRWVIITAGSGNRRWVEMAARRGRIPVKWASEQWLDPSTYRIYYHHIAGITKGMTVVWSIEPRDNAVHVSIIHRLTLYYPLIRSRFGQWIIGRFFVKPIAGQTLRQLKSYLEEQACAEQSSPDSDP